MMHKIKIRQQHAVKQKEIKEELQKDSIHTIHTLRWHLSRISVVQFTLYNLNFCVALHFLLFPKWECPNGHCFTAVALSTRCDFSVWSTSKGAVDLHNYGRVRENKKLYDFITAKHDVYIKSALKLYTDWALFS